MNRTLLVSAISIEKVTTKVCFFATWLLCTLAVPVAMSEVLTINQFDSEVSINVDANAEKLILNEGFNSVSYDNYDRILKHIDLENHDSEEIEVIKEMLRSLNAGELTTGTMDSTDMEESIDAHHSILSPKVLVEEATGNKAIFNSATVNSTLDITYLLLTISIIDPDGSLIGSTSQAQAYLTETNRMHVFGKVDSAFIEQNYKDDDILTIESLLVFRLPSGVSKYQILTNQAYARDFKLDNERKPYEVTVSAPVLTVTNMEYDHDYIKICLNRDHGDCDISQLHIDMESNSDFKLYVPLSGEIKIDSQVTDIVTGDDDTSVISGSETGAWVMTAADSDNGVWSALNNKVNKSFSDYITKTHYITNQGSIGTVLSWNIPMEEAAFGTGLDEWETSLYRRAENMQWEVRFKIKTQNAIDGDGDLTTTEDIQVQPGSELETVLVVENATVEYEGWIYPDQLPYLRVDY